MPLYVKQLPLHQGTERISPLTLYHFGNAIEPETLKQMDQRKVGSVFAILSDSVQSVAGDRRPFLENISTKNKLRR